MTQLTIELDRNAVNRFDQLMTHYKLKDQAAVISKALAALTIFAAIDSTDGELIARKGEHETRIIVS